MDQGFSGNIHLIFHQGLGDTVNGHGIYRSISKRLPHAHYTIHANKTWKSVIQLRNGDTLRLFSQNVDRLHPDDVFIDQYQNLLQSLRREFRSSPKDTFCALGPVRTADQYARGESLFENSARIIGLQGPIRPFVPRLTDEIEKAYAFLQENSLSDQPYCVMAPHTWPEKQWKTEEFECLGKRLLEELGLRTIVMGHRELEPLKIPGSVLSFDLSLPVLATIMERASIFIGLDSGPAHMAASFDIPLVVLYFQKDKVPFDIRPNTPFSQLLVGAHFGSDNSATAKTVFELVKYSLKKKLSRNIACPACGRAMDFVTEADLDRFLRICICGSRLEEPLNVSPDTPVQVTENEWGGKLSAIPLCMPGNLEDIERLKEVLKKEKTGELRINLACPEPRQQKSLRSSSFHWAFDGVLKYFDKEGLKISGVNLDKEILSVTFGSQTVSFWPRGFYLNWGGKTVRMPSIVFYYKYFAWQAWASSYQWRRMSQFAREEKKFLDAVRLAWVVLKFDPCPETVRFFFQNLLGMIVRR